MEWRNTLKFLILGATGMAGHTITYYLREQGHNVTTYSRTHIPFGKSSTGDITDSSFLQWILLNNYDVVINCIGVLNEACDANPEKAIYLNSNLPHAIIDGLKNTKTKLIHMSTDGVFSGKAAPYSENSIHDGKTLYDQTKSLGEIISDQHLTFRNSIIGPDMKENGIGLFNWFMKQSGTINGYTGAIWTGVTTLTLAKAIEQAAAEDITGLYHLVNSTSISKFDLLQLFNKHFKDNKMTILPSPSVNIDRTLLNNRKDFSFIVPSYEEMIIEMKEWIESHKNLYPHYYK